MKRSCSFLFPVLSALSGILVVSCGGSDSGASGRPGARASDPSDLTVYVVNYPLEYFAERIGGEHVEVFNPAPAEIDPALWSPEIEVIGDYQQADLILLNGAGYAQWVSRAALPPSRTVDTSAALADRLMQYEGATTHSHGPEGEHSHAGYAPHVWLDPQLAIAQAEAIAEAFSAAAPEHAESFASGMAALRDDLLRLDSELEAVAADLGETPVLFSHPIYQYLIRRYGLNAASVHWEPTEEPGHYRWVQFEENLAVVPASWMFWDAEPLQVTVEKLEERGVKSLVFGLADHRPGDGDFLSVMKQNAAALRIAAGSEG